LPLGSIGERFEFDEGEPWSFAGIGERHDSERWRGPVAQEPGDRRENRRGAGLAFNGNARQGKRLLGVPS
jgi:hypothetical protein